MVTLVAQITEKIKSLSLKKFEVRIYNGIICGTFFQRSKNINKLRLFIGIQEQQNRTITQKKFFMAFPDASVDFLNHYRLVESGKIDMYARAFVVNDEDLDFNVNARVSNVKLR